MTGEGLRTRTIFLGSGRFGLPVLALLADHPSIHLVGVITAPPRLAGRRAQPSPTPIHRATPDGVPVIISARLRSPDALATIAALEPDLAVLADYGQIVPAPILDLRLGALNVHPSLLPSFPGLHAQKQAVERGVRWSGATVHLVDSGLDTGPIILQEPVSIDPADTEESLKARILEVEHRIYPRAVDLVARGGYRIEGGVVYFRDRENGR